MKIREIFRNPIERRIEEVIKVDVGDERTVADEISEYVVTEHLRREFEKVLDGFQETISKPAEAVTVWVSGFFGSGKSSFAKVLGYVLENPVVQGRAAVDRFLERIPDDRLRALLATIQAQAPCLSVFVDLSTSRHVLREGESMVLPLYRALLDRLGYARDVLLAELEYGLEGDGELQHFERAFKQVTGKSWSERRHVILARNEASHALSLLRPQTYPSADSWLRGAAEPQVAADWFADRAVQLLHRRAGGKKRLVFIVDEVGQYAGRSEQRIYDLMGLAHAVQKKRGAIWLIATAQEKLEAVVDSLEGRRAELARVRDRFLIKVDLVPADIQEVVARRVLEKTAKGADAVRKLFRANRNRLVENTRLSSPARQQAYSEEEFVRLYPLLPYQVQLFIDAVSAHRGRGGASPMLGGSNRTLIKLAQQFIVHPKTSLGERDVGVLVTTAMGYDLLEGITPTAWQAVIEQVATRHGRDAVPTRVAKTIALLDEVRALKLEAPDLGVLLHPAVDAENLRAEVEEALGVLVAEEVVRQGDKGFKLQSVEERNWERDRRAIDMRPAVWHRMRRELIRQLGEGVAVEQGRTFRVGLTVNGERLVDGDLEVVIEEAESAVHDELRARSREKGQTLFWAYAPSDETLELARELYRSLEMIRRYEDGTRPRPEGALLSEERARQARLERRLRSQFEKDLLSGFLFFEGTEEQARSADFRSTLKECLAGKIDRVYPRLREFTAPVKREDPTVVLRSDNLEGLPAYLKFEGLGVLRPTPAGLVIATDSEPLATVLAEVKDRSSYGQEATGRYLEERFGKPPFGAVVEVIQVLLALLVRAGAVEVITQGARIADPRDPRMERVFATLPSFRATAFAPQRDVDPDMRARVARRLQEVTGKPEPIAAEHLASRIREELRSHVEVFTGVAATLRALGLPVPDSLDRARDIVEFTATASHDQIIKTCDEAWEDLRQGLQIGERWQRALSDATVEMLREAKQLENRGPVGAGPQEKERLAKLSDLLYAPDLVTHLGTVGSLVAEQQQAYRSAHAAVIEDLRRQTEDRMADIRKRFGGVVADTVLAEALRPLRQLLPEDTPPQYGHDLEMLRTRFDAVRVVAARVESDLMAMASSTEVVRIRLRHIYDGVVTCEEELEALIERVRLAVQEALAQGKHVLLE